jgi:transcriptional regulator
MYLPPHFRRDDPAELYDLIDAAAFGTLITVADGRPLASHVPMLLHRDRGPSGTLACHLSRANPQWAAIGADSEALAIFMGPDAYISPNWYESKREHGKVVPTWNYVTVHATGSVRLIEDPHDLRAHVAALTRRHEANRPEPWAMEDAPESYIAGQLRGIVGIEICISRLEGKCKLGQNRPAADIEGAIAGLEASDAPGDSATAAAMRAAIEKQ